MVMEKKLELDEEKYKKLLNIAVEVNDFLLKKVHEESNDSTEALSFSHEIIARLAASHCMAICEHSKYAQDQVLSSIINRVQSIFNKKQSIKKTN